MGAGEVSSLSKSAVHTAEVLMNTTGPGVDVCSMEKDKKKTSLQIYSSLSQLW